MQETGSEGHGADVRVEEERVGSRTRVLAVHGDADLHVAHELRARLSLAIDEGVTSVVLDLSETTFVDSTALGVLLGATKRLRPGGGQLRLVVRRAEVRRIFEITLLDRIVPLHATREEALAAAARETRRRRGGGNGRLHVPDGGG